jgi:hypothetical protein
MFEFRSLLKEVILLNNRLKENGKQSQVCTTKTDEKENVACGESNSNSSSIAALSPLLGHERTVCPHHQEVQDLADGIDECNSLSTGESQVDHLVLNSDPAAVDSQGAVQFCLEDCAAVQVMLAIHLKYLLAAYILCLACDGINLFI